MTNPEKASCEAAGNTFLQGHKAAKKCHMAPSAEDLRSLVSWRNLGLYAHMIRNVATRNLNSKRDRPSPGSGGVAL